MYVLLVGGLARFPVTDLASRKARVTGVATSMTPDLVVTFPSEGMFSLQNILINVELTGTFLGG
jgi:hypothetical protein